MGEVQKAASGDVPIADGAVPTVPAAVPTEELKKRKGWPGSGPGRPPGSRNKTISERLLEGFGQELTRKRAREMAKRDPFRAAELAVRIEQAPNLRALIKPPQQYEINYGTGEVIDGESERVADADQVQG